MMTLRIYAAFLKDDDKENMLQPFVCVDDEAAADTVKNAIREDESILGIAMSERIKLKWICDICPEDGVVNNGINCASTVYDEIYFRKYAQSVYSDNMKRKANETEAVKDD